MSYHNNKPALTRYRMKQRLIAIGEDFDIENEAGERVYHVDGKVMTVRDTLIITDCQGNKIATIKEKLITVKDTMQIYRGDEVIASVRKKMFSPFREQFNINVTDGDDLEAKGNIIDHEYEIKRGHDKIASVSKKMFSFRDSYGIEIIPGEDDVLILASAVVIDMLSHPNN